MATVRGGFTVLPHVQAFADACQKATGADSYGTYAGHQPTPQRALDIFHTVNDTKLAQAVSDFYVAHWREFGGDYIIDRQRIWNPEISPNWRLMGDRGGATQNHLDHNHVSFEATASGLFVPAVPSEVDTMFSRTDPQTRHLAFVNNGLLLGAAHGGGRGFPCEAYYSDGQRDARYVIWGHQDGTVSLVTPEIDGKRYAVDIPNFDRKPGKVLALWDFHAGKEQRFEQVMTGHNTFKYQVPGTDLVIDAFGDVQTPGEVGLFPWHGGKNQQLTHHRTI